MFTCPHCSKTLNEQPAATAGCPHCGRPLFEPAKPKTVANFPDQTLQFDVPPHAPTTPPPAASGVDRTLDSGDSFAVGYKGDSSNLFTLDHDSTSISGEQSTTSKKPGTLHDRNIQATMDSGSASQIDCKIDGLWGGSGTPSSPYVTMRSQSPTSSSQFAKDLPENSTLVIRERALRGAEDRQLHIADYDLIEVLGEGGMGVVYTARQASVDREVAVKMLKPEMLDNSTQRRKFLSEAVVTGELDHPNIVPIYDVGQNADGALFYSMKKVQGTPWSKSVGTRSLIDNIGILLKVADAVAFAHARGVIHRDLKPENVMLGDFGEVLVLDWGLAVATEGHRPTPNVQTEFGIAGTPAYMSPELAMGPLDQIGKHSDLYLLGAILYEIITSRPPHQGKHAMDCLRSAAKNEIAPTEKRGELVDIALRAMHTDPAKRHASVQDFQAAIRDYQSHSESIALSERAEHDLDSATSSDDYRIYARALLAFEEAYKLWDGNETALQGISRAKLLYASSALRKNDYDLGLSLLDSSDPAHKNVEQQLLDAKRERDARHGRLKAARRVMIGLVAMVFLAVTVGIVLTTMMKFEADRQRVIAENKKLEADQQKAEAEKQRKIAVTKAGEAEQERDNAQKQEAIAIDAKRQAEYEAYVALISMASAKIDENAFGQAAQALAACQANLRGWEWARLNYVISQSAGQQLAVPDRVQCLAADASGKRIAIGGRDGVVRLWMTGASEPAKIVFKIDEPGASIHSLAFSPVNENLLAIGTSASDKLLQVIDVNTGKAQPLAGADGHHAAVVSAVFSRDGQRLLTASHDHTAKLWNLAARETNVTYKGHSWLVWSAIFSLDAEEKYIATASEDGTVRLWETATGNEWKSPKGEPIPFTGHQGPVYALAFLPRSIPAAAETKAGELPDLGYLASAGYDKRILMWQPRALVPFDYKKLLADEPVPQTPFIEFAGHTAAVRAVGFNPQGDRLLSASSDNSLRVWYAADLLRGKLEKELRGHDGPVQAALYIPGREHLVASAGFDRKLRLWNLEQYQEQKSLPAQALRGHLDGVMAARFTRDGQSVLTASRDRTARRWSVDGKEQQTFHEGHAYLTSKAIFFPAGDRLLTAAVDGTVRVWNVRTGAEALKIDGTGYRSIAALSPSGRWILTGSDKEVLVAKGGKAIGRREGAILWDAETGKQIRHFSGHKVPVTAAAFSNDGTLVFTGDENGVGNLWKTETGEHLQKLEFHLGPITAAVFSPDDQRLWTGSVDKNVCPWDLHDLKHVRSLPQQALKHSATINALALTFDGQRLLTGVEDGTTRFWDVGTSKLLWTAEDPDAASGTGSINAVAISPKRDDAVALVVDSVHHSVRLLDLATGREILSPSADGKVDHYLNLRSKDALGWSAAFSPDGEQIVTVGGDEARLWDRQGVEVASFGPHRPLTFIGVSQNDEWVVTAGWDNSARIWNAKTGAAIITLDDHVAGELGGHRSVLNSADFSPDGAIVLTASDDGTLRVWDTKSGKVLQVLKSTRGAVSRAAFMRDGQRFIAAFRGDAQGASAGIWPLLKQAGASDLGKPQIEFVGHTSDVLDLALSHDERYLVTGSADNSARVWNALTGAELLKLEGHSGEVSAVAISADGAHLRVLTGAADHTAKLWDVSAIKAPIETRSVSDGPKQTSAKELLTLRGHTRGVTSVGFSPDGRSALTASRDGLSIIWPTLPEATR